MAASDIITDLRAKSGLSRKKFAKLIGLNSAVIIWMYEHKKRYPSKQIWMKLVPVAKELGVILNLDDLME
jgi:transcriptional regulator with XRE-family HTH domain